MPRPKAKQPWFAEGISRSTWYRRRKKAREQVVAAQAAMTRQAVPDRLEWQIAQLRPILKPQRVTRTKARQSSMNWLPTGHLEK